MPKNRKSPNYLKFILIVFAVIIISLVLLSFFTDPVEKINNNDTVLGSSNYDIPDIVSGNLISYIKQKTITGPSINDNSPILGNIDAPITIFEFSCFGCPASRKIQPILDQLLDKYESEIKIVWKDLLIPEIYPEAEIAHVAARCAQRQDKFWEYSKLLWNNQNDFSRDNLKNLASEIDIDTKEFEECLDDKDIIEIINSDIDEAAQLSIPGTPHFYINTQEISGIATLEDFEQIINVELSR